MWTIEVKGQTKGSASEMKANETELANRLREFITNLSEDFDVELNTATLVGDKIGTVDFIAESVDLREKQTSRT